MDTIGWGWPSYSNLHYVGEVKFCIYTCLFARYRRPVPFSNVDAETQYSSIPSLQQEPQQQPPTTTPPVRFVPQDTFAATSPNESIARISVQNGEIVLPLHRLLCDPPSADTVLPQASTTAKVTDWVTPGDKSGEFKRQVSSFRDWISREAGAQYPPEKGRYHLYVSYACPWAHRTLIARKLKGLEDIVSFSVVHWHLAQGGWRFVTADEKLPGDNVVPDPVEGHGAFTHLSDLYFESEKDFQGRYTVPVLYDKKTNRIVSNESSEILRMFGTEVNPIPFPAPLYEADLIFTV